MCDLCKPLARQCARYRAQRDDTMLQLERWFHRWLESEDAAKGEFDSSEPGFSDLLDQTRKILFGKESDSVRQE